MLRNSCRCDSLRPTHSPSSNKSEAVKRVVRRLVGPRNHTGVVDAIRVSAAILTDVSLLDHLIVGERGSET